MFTRFSPNIQAIILAFFGFAAFAVSDTIVKILTETYPILQVVGFYSVGILIICAVLQKPLGGFKRSFQTSKLKYHIARGVTYTILSIIIVTALSKLDLSIFYTIIFTAPFIIAILAKIFFQENIGIHPIIAIILGFLGVLIVMRPGMDGFTVWMLLPLIAALFVASLSLLAKSLGHHETLLSLALYPALSNLFVITIPTVLYYGLPQLTDIFVFITASTFGTIGLICTALAYQIGKANFVAPMQYSQIIWSILFSIVIFKVYPDLWTLVGAGVIIASGLYLIHTKNWEPSISE